MDATNVIKVSFVVDGNELRSSECRKLFGYLRTFPVELFKCFLDRFY